MEKVNQVFNFLNRLTETEKNQADALAGGDFEKLLAEFELIQTNFGQKKWARNSVNLLDNSRACDIRDIFLLQHKQGKKTKPPIFDKDTPFDLRRLRRDPATIFKTPTLLEKRFEIFGPTLISGFV